MLKGGGKGKKAGEEGERRVSVDVGRDEDIGRESLEWPGPDMT